MSKIIKRGDEARKALEETRPVLEYAAIERKR